MHYALSVGLGMAIFFPSFLPLLTYLFIPTKTPATPAQSLGSCSSSLKTPFHVFFTTSCLRALFPNLLFVIRQSNSSLSFTDFNHVFSTALAVNGKPPPKDPNLDDSIGDDVEPPSDESDNEEIEVQKSPTVEATPTAAIDDGMALDDHDFLGLDFAEESSTTDGQSSGGPSVLTIDMLRKRTHSDIEVKGTSQPSSSKRAKLSGGDEESDGDGDDTISRTILIQDLGEGRGKPFYDDVEQAWPAQGDWSQAVYLGSPASNQRLFLIHRWLQTFHLSIADITEA